MTAGPGDDRMNLERNNYGHNTIEKNSRRSGRDPETGEEGHGTTNQEKKLMSITWNTGLAAERARAKNKSEPPADKKLIKRLHDKWCRANGYKPQASSSKLQAPSSKRHEKDIIK